MHDGSDWAQGRALSCYQAGLPFFDEKAARTFEGFETAVYQTL
jgi:hypothetical protein